jgi:hypothetical protein
MRRLRSDLRRVCERIDGFGDEIHRVAVVDSQQLLLSFHPENLLELLLDMLVRHVGPGTVSPVRAAP